MRLLIFPTLAAATLLAASAASAAPAVATSAAGPDRTAASEFNPCGYDVSADTVNLRTGAGTRFASLGHLRKDDDVTVDRASGDWYHVTLAEKSRGGLAEGTAGWVHKNYVTPSVCMRLD
ncbi:SH3 domain-containing protein [Streptomyces sp. NPDC056144]|uniref:SH3 domain-containing protein n=1 Tax=unclassified Streptomyces TaxID=2593676 RepID=UPI0035D82F75